jgi:hypothetical protein
MVSNVIITVTNTLKKGRGLHSHSLNKKSRGQFLRSAHGLMPICSGNQLARQTSIKKLKKAKKFVWLIAIFISFRDEFKVR